MIWALELLILPSCMLPYILLRSCHKHLGLLLKQSRCLQQIVADGAYHPTINATMVQRAAVDYSPLQYPPTYLQALGYKCGCGQLSNNTCRSEFREVPPSAAHAPQAGPFSAIVKPVP